MTLAQLKVTVAAYLGKTTADLTSGGVDLFLVAANNARRGAEQLHNFEMARVRATLDIDGTLGGALSAAVMEGGTNLGIVVTGNLTPDVTGPYLLAGYNDSYSPPTPLYYKAGTPTPFATLSYGGIWYLGDGTGLWTKSLSTPVGVYTAGAGATGTATVALSTSRFSGIREIVALTQTNSLGYRYPVPFAREDVMLDADRDVNALDWELAPSVRYPGDADFIATRSAYSIVQRGTTLYAYPGATATTSPYSVGLVGYGWLSDYVAADLLATEPSDFFVQYGSAFLQWSCICELNYLFQKFVPRQEGVLAPPEKARDTAWQELLLWDSYMIDSHMNSL